MEKTSKIKFCEYTPIATCVGVFCTPQHNLQSILFHFSTNCHIINKRDTLLSKLETMFHWCFYSVYNFMGVTHIYLTINSYTSMMLYMILLTITSLIHYPLDPPMLCVATNYMRLYWSCAGPSINYSREYMFKYQKRLQPQSTIR